MSSTAEEIKHHVKVYVAVFAALACLTVITVAIAYLHLNTAAAVAVALFVASVKGSLVAAYFMHLISEKKVIFMVLILTIIFFAFLMLLPSVTIFEPMVTPGVS